ncbi:putative ABC transport system permease protein [Sagittula marina]|uniref:Putative ABC transport system permease protein n=1 Tax=Sagittula marina TaxID=943940 RepID=A0A7W6GT13_9RHOB|nr:ABC transporter permease [Sagittula marina]MBB3984694.1 putative ABC transport system permease protein [Sagittula marina]
MRQDLIIVWRGLLESPRRALFVIANIIFGVVVVALIDGYATSMFQGMRDGLIQSGLGHAQIFATDLEERGNLQSVNITLDTEQTDAILAALQEHPDFAAAARRIEASAMATNGEVSQVGTVIGIEPDQEAVISSGLRVIEGRELFADDSRHILIGEGMSDALGLGVGDELTILGNTIDGNLNALDLEIIGIFSTGNRAADARMMYVTLETGQAYLFTETITRVVAMFRSVDAVNAAVADLKPSLPAGVTIQDWRTLEPYYGEVVDLFSTIFLGIKIAILIFVALAIGNTIAICVVERTHEIGMIRAIGDQKLEITRRFTLEGLILGLVGTVLGIALVMVLASVLNNSGLNMPTPPGSSVDYPLRFILTPANLAIVGCLAMLVAFFASLSPAAKAANTPITEALRHV